MPKPIPKRQWGQSQIAGGRHAFRIGLFCREFDRRMRPPAKVLDAGCGDGAMTLQLTQRGYSVTAVDASPGGLERLAAGLAAQDCPGDACCMVGCLTALSLPDQTFDAIVSGEVLEHLQDHHAAVAEFNRVLKPGGLCFVTVPANPKLFSIEDQWAGHLRRYQKNDLNDLFKKAGFTTVDLHHWGWPVTYVYNRLLFKAWVARKVKKDDPEPDATDAIAANPVVIRAMSLAFSIDRLFTTIPWGIGLVGVFRKD